jgi:hypothetical protein
MIASPGAGRPNGVARSSTTPFFAYQTARATRRLPAERRAVIVLPVTPGFVMDAHPDLKLQPISS